MLTIYVLGFMLTAFISGVSLASDDSAHTLVSRKAKALGLDTVGEARLLAGVFTALTAVRALFWPVLLTYAAAAAYVSRVK